jgi:hypothetical protein
MKPEGSLLCTQELATGPYPESDESSPHLPTPISLRSIWIVLPFCQCIIFHVVSSLLVFQIKLCMHFSPVQCVLHALPHTILITLIILGEAYNLESSLCSLLQPPTTSSLRGPNILLSTLFSDTLNPCSSLSARDQVLHPYKKWVKLQFCIF